MKRESILLYLFYIPNYLMFTNLHIEFWIQYPINTSNILPAISMFIRRPKYDNNTRNNKKLITYADYIFK